MPNPFDLNAWEQERESAWLEFGDTALMDAIQRFSLPRVDIVNYLDDPVILSDFEHPATEETLP
jgi:hypothetical protein